jgi:hypothetical protein
VQGILAAGGESAASGAQWTLTEPLRNVARLMWKEVVVLNDVEPQESIMTKLFNL